MIQIDWQSGVPIYDQLIKGIIHLKTLGALKPHDQLPSVRSFAVSLGINPNTVQKAYQILEARGITYSVSGKGSYLSDSKEADLMVQKEAGEKLTECIKEAKLTGLTKERIMKILIDVYADGGEQND